MKKNFILSTLTVLFFTYTPAFAQFPANTAKALLNTKNLEKAILSAQQGPALGKVIVTVPSRVAIAGKIALTRASLPPAPTPVSTSLELFLKNRPTVNPDTYYRQAVNASATHPLWHWEDLEEAWVQSGGKGFYSSQSELSVDLDRFYGGRVPSYTTPDGKEVKLYMLPVNNILYKPVGYEEPVVLQSDRDFIIYYTEWHTGQLAVNSPEILTLFKEKSWYKQQKMEAEKDRAANQQIWERNNYPTIFSSQDELGKGLHQFYGGFAPKATNKITRKESYIYEIPVQGLVYAPDGGTARTLDPTNEVVLYNEQIGGQIIERATLETPLLFELH